MAGRGRAGLHACRERPVLLVLRAREPAAVKRVRSLLLMRVDERRMRKGRPLRIAPCDVNAPRTSAGDLRSH